MVDFLSFAAEKERQRLQKIAQKRSEVISETESVVQPSKVAVVARIASIFCTDVTAGNWRGGPRAVYDAYATTRRPQQAQPQLPFRGGDLHSREGLHFQTQPGAHSSCK